VATRPIMAMEAVITEVGPIHNLRKARKTSKRSLRADCLATHIHFTENHNVEDLCLPWSHGPCHLLLAAANSSRGPARALVGRPFAPAAALRHSGPRFVAAQATSGPPNVARTGNDNFAAGRAGPQFSQGQVAQGNLLKANSEPIAVDSIRVNSVTRS